MISRSVRSPRSNGYSHHEQTEPNTQRDNPATRQADGAYRVHLSPNFIVSSVDRVTIAGPKGLVADQTNPLAGSQTVLVPPGLTPGNTLSITCRLNHDRLVPSTTEKTQRLVIR